MQLVAKAKEGSTIPDTLPPSLLPFKVSPSAMPNAQAGFMMPGQVTPGLIGFNVALISETKVNKQTNKQKQHHKTFYSLINFPYLFRSLNVAVGRQHRREVQIRCGLQSARHRQGRLCEWRRSEGGLP